ncbi:MAG: hypothetical protein JNL80_01500 [Phycisphaerae bacterium]|jgi:hypothetical protein|nr:hypothetical protein [Phycisphaerae bacterium]
MAFIQTSAARELSRAIATALLFACSPAMAGDLVLYWGAESGVLPTERCWDHVNPQFAPPIALERGAVVLGETTNSGNCYFEHYYPPISFADGAAIQASVKVDTSTWYAANPYKRAGFSIGMSDSAGKWARLMIASDRLLLHTADQNWSDLTYLVNTTDAFHTYRVEYTATTATVYMDGVAVLTDTLGSGTAANRALVGDLTGLAYSKTRTQYVQVEGVPVCSVADIDCSGVVNASDLAILIGAWGTSLCEADLNGDGNVNGLDLAILLGMWG